ncbi:MAG TPA: ABC transporter substrate-binding protein [Candidatus Acidoferrum sp.]|nr:ABC transporter substrate-binding protein [Candidatus Acidoferrum sp.]
MKASLRSLFPTIETAIQHAKWAALFATVAALTLSAARGEAQQPTKLPKIGYLSGVSPAAETARREAFNRGLREFGYVEGKTILIEYRYSEGRYARLAGLATELVRLKPDLIVTGGSPSTRAAKNVTRTIPIIMTNDPDPLANGLVASLALPAGNVTGLSTLAPELSGKRLAILREVVSTLTRVAVFSTSTSPAYAPVKSEIDFAAKALKLQLQYQDVLDGKDIEPAFRAATKERADALITLNSGVLVSHAAQIVSLAEKNRLPATYTQVEYVEAGGLMFYGVSLVDLSYRAATFVDKILKGVKPADLPVEQPKKFEFVINLKAAKQIGLTIPPNVLARADRIIR